MSNMSYCRFQNTLQDLLDCYDHMSDQDLSEHERKARKQLLEVCYQIVEDYQDEVEED